MLQPWQQESELAMLRDWFYPQHTTKDPYAGSEPKDMRKRAIGRVNAWTFKSNRVPHAILVTADLVDSMLHHDMMTYGKSEISYRAIQFMFAFAFMRFVNGFVDRDIVRTATATLAVDETNEDIEKQPKAAGESSMYAHAAAIGMPIRFVDLRHQVSHGGLPDLNALKAVAEEALEWLWDRWWKLNANGDPGQALRRFQEREQLRRRGLEAKPPVEELEQPSSD